MRRAVGRHDLCGHPHADGTADRLDPVPSDYALVQLIRGVRLKLYPDARHEFLFQDEKAFVPLIESFLH